MDGQDEDYEAKAKEIFRLLNIFRKNPKELAKKLELLRTYLDTESNILSEPGKIQIQMVEGDSIFKEAIHFLRNLTPLQPLEWDENLTLSAKEHVNDIGPKGLLLYQSSDGTEPEDRISKYGNYSESLGENIDFGPNDAMGVIISLTLDDGEDNRPHRENLFKEDYHKVGIACGAHQSEYQMCVMDFAYDFQPLNKNNNNKYQQEIESNYMKQNYVNPQQNNNLKGMDLNQELGNNNSSPLVKLSLEQENLKNEDQFMNQNKSNGNDEANDEIEKLTAETKNLIQNMKIVSKKVEITTKITYTYEDGSTKVVTQNENHEFKC